MKEIYDFLKACPCYFIATMDGDQPRVRPFGTILLFEDKRYMTNAKGSICSFTAAPKEFCF